MTRSRRPCSPTNSVVKDVVFHGTNVDFDRFDDRYLGSSTDAGTLGAGFYFISTYEAALSNAEWVVWKKGVGSPIVKSAVLLLCKPYLVTRANEPKNLESDPRAARRFTNGLIRQGFDGVVHTMDHRLFGGDVVSVYVVFSAEQIVMVP